MAFTPYPNIQRNACHRCAQGVMDADRYDQHGRLIAYRNDHLYGRCACGCHSHQDAAR